MLLLNCLVYGETPAADRLSTVEVAKSKTVAILRDVIKEKKQPMFNHIPADQLAVWKVSLPLDSSIDKVLKDLVLEDKKCVQKLLPAKKLSSYFTDEPAEEHLHVIVEPPSTLPTVPSKREHEQEEEVPRKFPRIPGATSISGTRIFETERGNDKRLELPYGIPNFYDFRTSEGMLFADKTIYIEHLEGSQGKFRYTFLRPRRFGKSAFLGMLCQYYDIHNAEHFNDLFGPLYIGKNPTQWRNKHLVLKFDLSSISVSGSVDQMKMSFHDKINDVLTRFIKKYCKELGNPQTDAVINTRNAASSLGRVLGLVSDRGHTLFVGVDEYDAPANNSAFTGKVGFDEAILEKVTEIEQFFKESFFAVLKEGCGTIGDRGAVISKYFVTGVTPAFRKGMSPLHEAQIISGNVELHGICGFTEEEVTTLVQHYLRKDKQEADKIVYSMRRLYNGYYFASTAYDESNPQPPLLYNPQLVFHYIRTYESSGVVTVPNEYTAVHSTHVLRSIADSGGFSVDDLIQLIMSGSVETKTVNEFGYVDLLSLGKDRNLTWSLFLYMGLLTRGPREGHLRIPNDVIKTEVLERIISYLHTLDQIRHLIGPAFDNLVNGSANEFIEFLKTFLQTRTVRSLRNASEAVLQGIVELLLDKPTTRVPELWLVADGTKEQGDGRYGFVDMFIPPQTTGSVGSRTRGVILELKYINLEGLWKGETKDWKRPYIHKQVEDFKNKIQKEYEQHLLARKYMYYAKDLQKVVLTTVGAVMEDAVKQLKKYMDIVAKGEPKTYYDFGVPDTRVKIKKGTDDLQGHVIMAIAGDHVLVRSTELVSTSNEYHNMMQL